jgi:hypothetical protein
MFKKFYTVQHKKHLRIYNTLALPTPLYGSKNWTIEARNARRITSAEMKCVRRIARCCWTDRETNTEIAKELNRTSVLDKMQDYKRNWM